MSIKIGSYEAKTKLPELLRGVHAGNRYTITLRGEAIADLVPAERNKNADAIAAVEQMYRFMMAAPRLRFVLDNSVSMCWLEPPSKPGDAGYAAKVLKALTEAQALVQSCGRPRPPVRTERGI